LLRGRWAGTALVLVGLFPRGVASSNPLREKVRRVNLGLSSLVAREGSERLLFLDAAALMPLQPDGALDRAWTFDYVHLTTQMYARYGDALLTVLRPFVQPR
jgi:lysophospholipase L1-like esterase